MDYNKDYHKLKHSYLIENKEYYLARAKLAFKWYFSKIEDINKKKVLEFGGGLGQNVFLLKNRVVYDISKFSLNFCEERGIQIIKDYKKIPNDSFDIILSCHCLEHLENPLENLKFLHKKLKTDGKLILVIPRSPHITSPFQPDENYELFAWNFRTINNLLDSAGFRVVNNKYIRRTMMRKLVFLNKLSFKVYSSCVYLAGLFLNSKEMKIEAVKK